MTSLSAEAFSGHPAQPRLYCPIPGAGMVGGGGQMVSLNGYPIFLQSVGASRYAVCVRPCRGAPGDECLGTSRASPVTRNSFQRQKIPGGGRGEVDPPSPPGSDREEGERGRTPPLPAQKNPCPPPPSQAPLCTAAGWTPAPLTAPGPSSGSRCSLQSIPNRLTPFALMGTRSWMMGRCIRFGYPSHFLSL